MVGKSDGTSSRIFHQCYLKCCKLQNLTPLSNVVPSGNGKVVDFCVDRIKYADWPPILNALSCDLSLHSVAVKCRQQVKTDWLQIRFGQKAKNILEHIDCERLAKTVNKRSVILTNFMLSNLVEAVSQLLSNTTLLTSLLLEGLPLKIPYLNPLCEALLVNSSLQHLYLPRSLIGDAGCLAICKAVRCLPNILTMDLTGCELTPLGAGYIADLIKYQKIHRYSENWVHTLRYRLPDLDTMAGLRRITLCGNPQLGDLGVTKILNELADDLWIKALDVQNCGLTEACACDVLQTMRSNTTLVILDMRHNPLIANESLSKIRAAVRQNERGIGEVQYSWLSNVSGHSSDGRSVKYVGNKNTMIKDRVASNIRNVPNKYTSKTNGTKKEKDYTEVLEEQLQEESSHRRQLEELNEQLVQQMRALKQQQIQLWQNNATSSISEQSLQASSRSGDASTSSGSSSIPIDQNTLSYIQQAFKDIYAFIKNNQCNGECLTKSYEEQTNEKNSEGACETEEKDKNELRVNVTAKKAQSAHIKLLENVKVKKMTQSAHLLGDKQNGNDSVKPEMFERLMGDSKIGHGNNQSVIDEIMKIGKETKKNIPEYNSPCSSVVSDSSDTLVYSPKSPRVRIQSVRDCINPRDALYSSSDEDS